MREECAGGSGGQLQTPLVPADGAAAVVVASWRRREGIGLTPMAWWWRVGGAQLPGTRVSHCASVNAPTSFPEDVHALGQPSDFRSSRANGGFGIQPPSRGELPRRRDQRPRRGCRLGSPARCRWRTAAQYAFLYAMKRYDHPSTWSPLLRGAAALSRSLSNAALGNTIKVV